VLDKLTQWGVDLFDFSGLSCAQPTNGESTLRRLQLPAPVRS
jgi:hypothetical protein